MIDTVLRAISGTGLSVSVSFNRRMERWTLLIYDDRETLYRKDARTMGELEGALRADLSALKGQYQP